MNNNFNDIINEYIKKGKKKELWELVFNYEDKVDVNKIADYYINEKDSFYICELISVAHEYLNLEDIFNKIVLTDDKEFVFWILTNGVIKGIVDSKYLEKLKIACDDK